MNSDFEKKLSGGAFFDGLTARAEIIPLVTKDDEAFLLYEDSIPEDMPMLPLRDNVLFPGVVMPITIGRKSSLKLVKAAERQNQSIVCVTQCNNTDEPTIDDIFNIGVVGRVLRVIELPQNQTMAVIQGTMKCSVECITETAPFMRCKAVLVDENFKPEHPRMFHNQVTEIRKLYSQLQEDKSNTPSCPAVSTTALIASVILDLSLPHIIPVASTLPTMATRPPIRSFTEARFMPERT